jgi:hypothetical protein
MQVKKILSINLLLLLVSMTHCALAQSGLPSSSWYCYFQSLDQTHARSVAIGFMPQNQTMQLIVSTDHSMQVLHYQHYQLTPITNSHRYQLTADAIDAGANLQGEYLADLNVIQLLSPVNWQVSYQSSACDYATLHRSLADIQHSE